MIFSINYRSPLKSRAEEIRCPYNQLGSVFDFIKEHPEKRYNIILTAEADLSRALEQVNFVRDVASDYTIECATIPQLLSAKAGEYNAYLRFPVTDWETYQNLRELGVSDIYIDGPLGFQVNQLATKNHDVKIRVSPTVSPNSALSADRKPNSFFIRPEDLHLYSDAIDVIDFKETNPDKENALFNVYTRGTFNFDINQLISGLPAINNLMFKEDFAKERLHCGQKCNTPNRHCSFCNNYFNILTQLKKINQV